MRVRDPPHKARAAFSAGPGGVSAGQAAFEVGYERVSQLTREYARMFQ